MLRARDRKRVFSGAVLSLLATASGCAGEGPGRVDSAAASREMAEQDSRAPSADSEWSLNSAARSLLGELAAGDLAAAAERFHYPPSYTAEQRAIDVAAVRNQLRILVSHFGRVQRFEETSGTGSIVHVGIGGGTGEYWQGCGNQSLVPFRVELERVPEGVALVRFCRMKGVWVLQALHLGGPNSDRDVQIAVAGAQRELLERFR